MCEAHACAVGSNGGGPGGGAGAGAGFVSATGGADAHDTYGVQTAAVQQASSSHLLEILMYALFG
jgi:hypothetical protein